MQYFKNMDFLFRTVEFVFTSSSARTTSSARVVVIFFFPFPHQSFISTSTGPLTSVHFEKLSPLPAFRLCRSGELDFPPVPILG